MASNIGTAYVQIEPSFEGVTGKIESQFGGEGEKASKSFGSGFGSVVGTVGKAMAGAAAAGAAAVGGMVKEATAGFAEYEQLVGGVETLYGNQYKSIEEYAKGVGLSLEEAGNTWDDYRNRQQTILDNASNAYKTAGLSANQYMETATGFAAALNASLGENAWQAANYADIAITNMADNANKMGTSMESIQNAYAGFAKGNFTMLDNLKLGYGGTKEEMQRLLTEAEKIEGYTKGTLNLDSFADIVEAIDIIQTNLGISGMSAETASQLVAEGLMTEEEAFERMGTTAKEGSTTIQGSLAAMQAAWQNVLTGMGTDGADLSGMIDNLISTASDYIGNIMPVIQQALQGVSQLISELAPQIAQAIPELITQILPGLLESGVDIIKTLGQGIIQAIPELIPTVTDVILELCDMLVQMLPELIQVGLQVILQLAMGIAQALPELIPAIVDTVLTIAEYLIDNVDLLIDAAIALMIGLAEGLINALPKLIEKAPEIVIKLVEAIIRNVPKILQAATELILMFIEGIVRGWTKILQVGKDIVNKVKEGFSDKVKEAKEWGKDMIQNFVDGIMAKFETLKNTVKQCAQAVKDFLGFSEPEEGPLSNFHTFAPDMMELFAEGITENAGVVKSALTEATSDIMSTGINVESVQSVQTSVSPVNVSQNEDRISHIENLLSNFIENFKQDIYLDTGALVGGTVRAYNNALGQIAVQGANR